MVISPSHSLIFLFPSHSGNLTISLIFLLPSHSGNFTISLSDHLIPFAQWESHHLTLRSSYSLHTVVISPSQSLIILFPSHSGNLPISDDLIPFESEMVTISLTDQGNTHDQRVNGEITTVAQGIRWSESEMVRFHCAHSGNKMIREWSSEIPLCTGNLIISESDGLIPLCTVVISPWSLSEMVRLPLSRQGITISLSDHGEIPLRDSGNLTISLWDHLIPCAQW